MFPKILAMGIAKVRASVELSERVIFNATVDNSLELRPDVENSIARYVGDGAICFRFPRLPLQCD